jgi:hypothetical protein
MFGRRSSKKDDARPGARHRRAELAGDAGDVLEEGSAAPAGGPGGPWDSADVSDPSAANRLDLGGMWLPGVPGMELRLEVDEESGAVLSAVCVLGQSFVQLRALAAPRSGGLWQEVRREIADDVREQGGQAHESEGPFGDEVLAEVPGQDPEGRPVRQQARFVGIERSRWLLQAVFTGEAATDPAAAAPLEDLVRDIVVVRGGEPMARGEALELRLPPQAPPGPRSGDDDVPAEDRPSLNPFARGPEITELH